VLDEVSVGAAEGDDREIAAIVDGHDRARRSEVDSKLHSRGMRRATIVVGNRETGKKPASAVTPPAIARHRWFS
jgi:hypothetical protein